MYKRCIAAFCLLSALQTNAQTLTGFSYPESIISDGKYLYVTNIGEGANPAAADSNGYVSKLTLDGKIIAKKWTNEKLNAPKGTAIIKDILYVADLNRIVCISVNTGKKVKEIKLDRYGASFAHLRSFDFSRFGFLPISPFLIACQGGDIYPVSPDC